MAFYRGSAAHTRLKRAQPAAVRVKANSGRLRQQLEVFALPATRQGANRCDASCSAVHEGSVLKSASLGLVAGGGTDEGLFGRRPTCDASDVSRGHLCRLAQAAQQTESAQNARKFASCRFCYRRGLYRTLFSVRTSVCPAWRSCTAAARSASRASSSPLTSAACSKARGAILLM